MDQVTTDPLLRGRSEQLRTFIAQAPLVRRSIVSFVAAEARRLPAGARVLDVGAGDAPYRELFERATYVTLDHPDTLHAGDVDIVATADAIPEPADSFDAIVCTEVLEHVPEPRAVLAEFARLLTPGGVVIATTPFAFEEHETPHDFYRYTRYGLAALFEDAGFVEIDVEPRSDSFTALAQLVLNLAWADPDATDGLDPLRLEARETLQGLADALLALAPLDDERRLPLGFSVLARQPGSPA